MIKSRTNHHEDSIFDAPDVVVKRNRVSMHLQENSTSLVVDDTQDSILAGDWLTA